jgi:signal transduction histidine kinase
VWVRNNVAVRDSGGAITKAVCLTEDITRRKLAEIALGTANRQLRHLTSELLRSQDSERRRIARELHDSTSQLLAGLSMNLSRLRELEQIPGPARDLVVQSIELATQCSREVRSLSYLLHPPPAGGVRSGQRAQDVCGGFPASHRN